MLFSNHPRTHYTNAPVHEVICQLRFPTILSINNVEPAEFQEQIRDEFPQYIRRQDNLPPKMNQGKLEPQPPVTNYNFVSADGKWRINLTRDFIALSTVQYPGWEEFARHLDKLLATFIQLYKPAYFQRVGLRYLNLISRKKLGLEGTPWSDLIAPAYSAAMQEEDANEAMFLNCSTELLMNLDSSCQAKIHAGPGRIKVNAPNAPQDPELKFVIDLDLSMNGQTPCTLAAAALETIHGHGTRLFEGAITDTLRDAMMA